MCALGKETITLWAQGGTPRSLPEGSQGELETQVVRSHFCPGDAEHPFAPAFLLGTAPHAGVTGCSPAVGQGQLQLRLGQLELLLADGVGQHLPVGVVGVGLCTQLKELPDGHTQGPAGGMAVRGGAPSAQLHGILERGIPRGSPGHPSREAVPPGQARACARRAQVNKASPA